MPHPQTVHHNSIPTPHIYTYTFVTTSQKNTPNKLQKNHFAKRCKNKSCRMHFHPKTLPKNQCNKRQCTQQCTHRLPTHHSAMHLPRSYHPYIFPTTPTTMCTTTPYSTAHPILLLTLWLPRFVNIMLVCELTSSNLNYYCLLLGPTAL